MPRRDLLFVMLCACLAAGVSSRPASVNVTEENATSPAESEEVNEKRSLYEQNTLSDNAYEIAQKIKTINDKLKKPDKLHLDDGNQTPTEGSVLVDKSTLQKIQQIIALVNTNPYLPFIKTPQDTNSIANDDVENLRSSFSKALRFLPGAWNLGATAPLPLPYITNMPVVVVPSMNDVYSTGGNLLNSMKSNDFYQTRQESPSLPFQFQWPLASFFPILVKDPLLGFLHGGGWNNFFEVGQSADVCNRKQKSNDVPRDADATVPGGAEQLKNNVNDSWAPNTSQYFNGDRTGRVLKKRNVLDSTPVQEIDNLKKSPTKSIRPLVTRKKIKKPSVIDETEDKQASASEGDLRFPFSDFSWFGNRKPVAPSPGFFINRLRVRKGGVAIAGPGGVATAGRGGTAIVGPGGLAYTQPGGVAVAGPAARVIALSPHTDLTSLVSQLHQKSGDGSAPRASHPHPEGRLVATGPVIYFHPDNQA